MMAPAAAMQELLAYVGFTDDDALALGDAHPFLEEHFDAVVDEFYRAILSNPGARAVFANEHQITRQKIFLRGWLHRLFGGEYDGAYYEERSRIGRAHVRVALPQRYMFAAMSVLRRTLADLVRDVLHPDDRGQERRLLDALHRICDVELAIMLESYREDYVRAMRAQERLATLGQFAGSVAHEMRNPLAVIQTSVHLLRKRVGDDEKITRHIERIHNQTLSCSRIAEDLLTLTREQSISLDHVDLATLLAEAQAQLPDGQRLTVEVQPHPEASLQADAGKLMLVMVNLLQNAQQAMGGEGLVRVGWEPQGEHVQVWLEDAGPGFSRDALAHALEPLFTTRSRGIGLGLALCRRIIEAHRGSLKVGNAEGGGARIEILLPAAPDGGSS